MPNFPIEPSDELLIEISKQPKAPVFRAWLEECKTVAEAMQDGSSDTATLFRMQGAKAVLNSILVMLDDYESIMTERQMSESAAKMAEDAGKEF